MHNNNQLFWWNNLFLCWRLWWVGFWLWLVVAASAWRRGDFGARDLSEQTPPPYLYIEKSPQL